MEQRLQRILAAAGLSSRRGAEEWIRAGRVTVNGRVAELGERADPERDDVRVDGEPMRAERLRYWLMHKPRDVLTTVADERATRDGRETVMDLLPPEARNERLYPVGRLDADSEGLLLLTNDGDIAHTLLHPSLGTEKEYRVTVRGEMTEETAARLAAGIELDDGPMAPCRVVNRDVEPVRRRTKVTLILQEGRKRQIRRAMQAVGHHVDRLVRLRMGPLRLGPLAPREVRPLTGSEVEALRRHTRKRKGEADVGGSTRGRGRNRPPG